MEQDKKNVRGRRPQNARYRFSPEKAVARMEARGYSAADMARALRVEFGVLGANLAIYLRPDGPRPGPELLHGLCTLLDCSIDDLMDEIAENGEAA